MFDKFLRIVQIIWMNKLYLVDFNLLSLPLEDPRPIDLDRQKEAPGDLIRASFSLAPRIWLLFRY